MDGHANFLLLLATRNDELAKLWSRLSPGTNCLARSHDTAAAPAAAKLGLPGPSRRYSGCLGSCIVIIRGVQRIYSVSALPSMGLWAATLLRGRSAAPIPRISHLAHGQQIPSPGLLNLRSGDTLLVLRPSGARSLRTGHWLSMGISSPNCRRARLDEQALYGSKWRGQPLTNAVVWIMSSEDKAMLRSWLASVPSSIQPYA